MTTTHHLNETTDEEHAEIVAERLKKIRRCGHQFKIVYPDFDTPFPVREIEVCQKCGASRSRRWVTREDGMIQRTAETGMGCGSLDRWKE